MPKVFPVDIAYSSFLHDHPNDYPFLPKHRDDKLTPTLNNKRYYASNDHNLIPVLKQRLRLVKIHRLLIFDLSRFLNQRNELDRNLRAKFKKTLRKRFLHNALFGKTLESIGKRSDSGIINDSNDNLKR